MEKYLIVGTGGVGGSIAGFLALAGKDVTCIARGKHLEAIREKGLHLRSDLKGNHFLPIQACTAEEYNEKANVIFVCVKGYSLDSIKDLLEKASDKDTLIIDGILEPDAPDFERRLMMLQRKPRARYRVNHISWWARELPYDEEYAEARRNLDAVGWQVDYIITHCAPTSIALMGSRHNEADRLTDFLQEVQERAKYHYWLFGHYHDNRAIDEKHILLWEQIVRII